MTFAEEVEADSPELWWDTRQAVGTAQPDRADNGHAGIVVGSPDPEAGGLRFDNSAEDQHIEEVAAGFVPSLFGAFAFEAVVDLDDLTDCWLGGWSGNTSSDYLTLTLQQRWTALPSTGPLLKAFGPYFGDELAEGYSITNGPSAPPSTGTLIHVIGEYDGTDINLYLDGVLEATDSGRTSDGASAAGVAAPLTEAGTKYHAGNDPFGFGSFGLAGLLRHSIFYDHDLGPTRAAAHAAAALGDDPGPGDPPAASDAPSLTLLSDVGDLTPYGEEPAFSIMRGTSSPGLTGFVAEAGTLGTQLTNISRDLDPLNLAGPFVTAGETDLLPGVGTTAAASYGGDDYPLFAGSVDGWPQTYPKDGTDQVVDFRATDVFRQLANAQLTLQRPSEYSGARIQAILDDFGYAGPTDIGHGNAIVGPLAFTTVSALSHIADVVMAEWGEFYESAAHVLTFRDRDTIATDTRSSESQATYVQSGGLNFSDVQMKSSTVSDIVNECVVVFSDTGQQVTERDEASIAMPWSQGIPRSLQISVPLSNASQARAYARWILQRYAYPLNTFTSVTLTPGNEAAGFDLWPECLGRELGDLVTVILDPLSAPYELSGDPIERPCVIRGIQHDFATYPRSTTFYLQDASWIADLWRWDVSLWDGPDVWGM